MWGYKGPPITRKLPKAKFVDMADLVPKMRLVKSPVKIALIEESAKWANLAVSLLQEYTTEGAWVVEVALAASLDTTSTMKKTLGVDFQPLRSIFPVSACFRGQIGEMSAIPHAMGTGRRIRRGDVLIAEAAVEIGGYSCELERTMIVGKPSAKQKRYFQVMVEAQRQPSKK